MAGDLYNPVPDVQPDATPADRYQRIQSGPESFGGAIARGTQKAGEGIEAVSQAAFNIRNFQDQVETDDQINKVMDTRNVLFNGKPGAAGPDGQPDTGYMGTVGQTTMERRESTQKQLDDAIAQGRNNLQSEAARRNFDVQTRRLRSVWYNEIGTHAATQNKVWASGVAGAGAEHARNQIAANPENEESVNHATADLVNFREKEKQIKYGDSPEALASAREEAKQEALILRVQSIGAHQPAKAMDMLDANKAIAGTLYDNVANQLRVRSEEDRGKAASQEEMAKAHAAPPPPAPEFFHARSGARFDGMDSDFSSRLQTATMDWETETGQKAKFNSLVRTYGEQAGLREKYLSGQGGLAAPPGSSAHEFGKAADIPEGPFLDWLHANASKYGLEFLRGKDYSGDAGHVQIAGFRPAANALQSASTSRAMAVRGIMERGDLSPREQQIALQNIEWTYRNAQIAAQDDTRARKQQSDQAYGEYVNRALAPTSNRSQILADMAQDNRLEPQVKWNFSRALEASDGDDVAEWSRKGGPAFWDIFKTIGSPGGPRDRSELLQYAGPGGGLTLQGVDKLGGYMADTRKSADGTNIHKALEGQLKYAEGQLSFDQELLFPGAKPLVDQRGRDAFNAKFLRDYLSAYDDWVIRDKKSPWDFINQKKTDELLKGIRDPAEMAQSRIAAGAGVVGALEDKKPPQIGAKPTGPIPPAPQGVNQGAWTAIMNKAPPTADGKGWPPQEWATAIGRLRANPTPEMKAAFNAKFGAAALHADDILNALGGTLQTHPLPEHPAQPYPPGREPSPSLHPSQIFTPSSLDPADAANIQGGIRG